MSMEGGLNSPHHDGTSSPTSRIPTLQTTAYTVRLHPKPPHSTIFPPSIQKQGHSTQTSPPNPNNPSHYDNHLLRRQPCHARTHYKRKTHHRRRPAPLSTPPLRNRLLALPPHRHIPRPRVHRRQPRQHTFPIQRHAENLRRIKYSRMFPTCVVYAAEARIESHAAVYFQEPDSDEE